MKNSTATQEATQPSLLEKALSVKTVRQPRAAISEDKIKLAVAWFKNEVTTSQVATALETTNVGGTMATVLRNAIASGAVKLA